MKKIHAAIVVDNKNLTWKQDIYSERKNGFRYSICMWKSANGMQTCISSVCDYDRKAFTIVLRTIFILQSSI